ncbi:MAG: isoleucine--tRNA ligase, partial [Bdellovibrio sp.]
MATNTYKETINLPKTDFPMKGNLPQTEPHMIKAWEANKIYEKMVSQNDPANKFVMPDGPPYANGNIHVGHVLNKVLKDIIIKYKNMCGQRAAFIPGWDCHGLPIELKVTKRLGSKGKEMSPQQIRQECRKEALKWVDTQREQFIRLGILAQWDKPYLTLSPDYEAAEIRVLAKIQKNGILYRGEKPVYWCTKLQTALAAAEVEYHDHTSPSIFVKFFLKPEDQQKIKNLPDPQKPLAFVIWTTTPWTLPANLAIALHPQFSYGLYEANSEYWIIAKDLKESFEKETGVSLKGPFKEFKGKELEGLKTQHPFMQRDSIIVLGEHVTLDAGTGCVHTAPGHGLEDYQVGLKYNLPTLS